jgi:PHD/YefM family antitoxin component YafN of YafNO toxin-antitoxin module
MNALSLQEASTNLPRIIAETIQNSDETLIVSDEGAVIMIDKDYWEEIQETLRLLSDKKSLTALLEGHRQRDQGIISPGKTMDEVFNDL